MIICIVWYVLSLFCYSNGLWYAISHSILLLYISFVHLSVGHLSNLYTVYCPPSFIFSHSALCFIFFFWISKPLIPQELKYFQIKLLHLIHLQAYFNISISWLFILFLLKVCVHKLGSFELVTPLLNYSLVKLFTLFRQCLYSFCTLVQ